MQAERRDMTNWKKPTPQALIKAFSQFDTDGDGVITQDEIKIALKKYERNTECVCVVAVS